VLGQLEQRHLARIADIDRVVHGRVHEPPDALDEIGHVGERARLGAVAVHGQRLAPQGLAMKVGWRARREPHRGPYVLKIRTMRVSTCGSGDRPW
jgi:hypothetical protein